MKTLNVSTTPTDKPQLVTVKLASNTKGPLDCTISIPYKTLKAALEDYEARLKLPNPALDETNVTQLMTFNERKLCMDQGTWNFYAYLELVRSSLDAQAQEIGAFSNTNFNIVLASAMENLPTPYTANTEGFTSIGAVTSESMFEIAYIRDKLTHIITDMFSPFAERSRVHAQLYRKNDALFDVYMLTYPNESIRSDTHYLGFHYLKKAANHEN